MYISIKLEDKNPFKLPYRRIPPGMYDEVREHIKEMLQAGVIRESNSNSNSNYSSNVVLVRKTDGSLRFCIDMRVLNSKTRKDCYMLPRFDYCRIDPSATDICSPRADNSLNSDLTHQLCHTLYVGRYF